MSESLKLSKKALLEFERNLFPKALWGELLGVLKPHKNQKKEVLDIGGGAGIFADHLLATFPKWHVTLVDNADYLLSRNKKSARKKLIKANAESLDPSFFGKKKFDFIFINLVLHHIITSNCKESRRLQERVISSLRGFLKEGGKIFILEQVYTPTLKKMPVGRLIHFATSSRMLTPVAKKLGANTAGVGVLFFDEGELDKILDKHGYNIEKKEATLDKMRKYLEAMRVFKVYRTLFVVSAET